MATVDKKPYYRDGRKTYSTITHAKIAFSKLTHPQTRLFHNNRMIGAARERILACFATRLLIVTLTAMSGFARTHTHIPSGVYIYLKSIRAPNM